MAASPHEHPSFLMIPDEENESEVKVEVTELNRIEGSSSGQSRKFISDDLEENRNIRFGLKPNNKQQWFILERDRNDSLWSICIRYGDKKLYVSYNKNGAVRMMPAKKGGEYERYFQLYLDENGGIRFVSKESKKNFMVVQKGVLTMLDGITGTGKKIEVADTDFLERSSICLAEKTFSTLEYRVEVNDPNISGLRWSIVDPIVGNNVKLVDRDDQDWRVRIDETETWTFHLPNQEIFVSSDGENVKFVDTQDNDETSGFSVVPATGTHGLYLTSKSNPKNYVGKSGRVLIMEDFQEKAIDWNLRVTGFNFITENENKVKSFCKH